MGPAIGQVPTSVGPAPRTPHNSDDKSRGFTDSMFSLRFLTGEKPYFDAKARLQPPQLITHSNRSDSFAQHERHSSQHPLHDFTTRAISFLMLTLVNLLPRRGGRTARVLAPGNLCFPSSATHSH